MRLSGTRRTQTEVCATQMEEAEFETITPARVAIGSAEYYGWGLREAVKRDRGEDAM